jgi:hypothetical protein
MIDGGEAFQFLDISKVRMLGVKTEKKLFRLMWQ